MPIGRLGSNLAKRVHDLETNFASGWMDVIVSGSSTGFGGTEAAIYVQTTFLVKAAVGNLAKEYDLRDAAQIYNFGNDIFSGQIRVRLPGTGVGFYMDFKQIDPNESWNFTFNWYARG
jgi:hypothetical protein